MTETDKKIVYLYRNGYRLKDISKKTGLSMNQVNYRLLVIRKKRKVQRWWEEGEES